ncbi:MAG: DUF222 domain-containing protein [Ilumatobacteraceae bacterium]
MDEVRVPSVDELVMMSPVQVDVAAHELEFHRRRFEAASAMFMLRVDTCGAFLADGHRRIAAWGRATNNWSTAESNRMAKLARAFKALPTFAQACIEGRIGVAQMHAVAAVAANPRVKEWLADADQLFATNAEELEFDELAIMLRHWEELADQDGTRSKYDKAIAARDAAIRFVGEKAYLDAQGLAHDGVLFQQVLDHFIDIEWRTEWDMLVATHGDAMCAALMERTPAQRRFDALQRLFAAAGEAAGSGADGRGALVNILIDQRTWEHELERMLGGDPEPIDPSHAPERRCQDADGHVLDARAVVAAAMVGQVRRLVIGADGVPLDMGRKQRLFRGALRETVLLAHRNCTHTGCLVTGGRCQADHLQPHAEHGETKAANGGPSCRFHNPFKNNGYRTVRDARGRYRTIRADGTTVGWPVLLRHTAHLRPDGVLDLSRQPFRAPP